MINGNVNVLLLVIMMMMVAMIGHCFRLFESVGEELINNHNFTINQVFGLHENFIQPRLTTIWRSTIIFITERWEIRNLDCQSIYRQPPNSKNSKAAVILRQLMDTIASMAASAAMMVLSTTTIAPLWWPEVAVAVVVDNTIQVAVMSSEMKADIIMWRTWAAVVFAWVLISVRVSALSPPGVDRQRQGIFFAVCVVFILFFSCFSRCLLWIKKLIISANDNSRFGLTIFFRVTGYD